MTYTALFLDREQKIRVNEFPEKPEHCAEFGKSKCTLEATEQDSFIGCACEMIQESYKEELQSALDTGILCEDQEEALQILLEMIIDDGTFFPKPLQPYRVNYRVEAKTT